MHQPARASQTIPTSGMNTASLTLGLISPMKCQKSLKVLESSAFQLVELMADTMPYSQALGVQLEAAQKAQAAAEARFESERAQRDLARRELAQREAEFAAKRRAVQLTAEETAAGSWARFKSAVTGGEGDAPRAPKKAARRRGKAKGKGRGFKDGAGRGKERRAASSTKGSASETGTDN